MGTYHAKVRVTLKPTVNDPQGVTIGQALRSLGFAEVERVRAGKYIEITLDAPDQAAAEAETRAMCEKLLANPVIEVFNFEVEPDR